MEQDAGVQGGVTDELLIALRGGKIHHEHNCPALRPLDRQPFHHCGLLFLFEFNELHESSFQALERQHVLIISVCNSDVF